MEQIGIALFGVVAVVLSQDARESYRKWACIFGMAGQPFWYLAAWNAEQWGIFGVSFLYTWGWWRGIQNHWLTK